MIRCTGSIFRLLNVKDSNSIQQNVVQSSFTIHFPAYCIPKAVVMESGEIIYEKVFVSPRPPPTISFKDNWMKELDSDIAGNSKDTQRIEPKPKTQLSRTGRPVGGQQSTQREEIDIDFRVCLHYHMQL